MENDKIYDCWKKEYSMWYIDYLDSELDNCWLGLDTYNLIKIINTTKLDNLEFYLFNKYWVEFVRAVKELIKKNLL
jgi:hypothetical protein